MGRNCRLLRWCRCKGYILAICLFLACFYTHLRHETWIADGLHQGDQNDLSYQLRQKTQPARKVIPCNNQTVHPWSYETMNSFNITCGLDSIQLMAETIITSPVGPIDDETERYLDLFNRLSTVLSPNQQVLRRRRVEGANAQKTKHSSANIPQHYENPLSKTLAFVKAYKVGGTHVASLLTMHAYLYNLELGRTARWMESIANQDKNETCVDVVGTTHPHSNFYHKLHKAKHRDDYLFYCRPVLEFMFIRKPTQRLWSGYHHTRRDIRGLSLKSYLRSKVQSKKEPHHMLSEKLTEATHLSGSLLMLASNDQRQMDKSLMLLSIEADMSVCDFMYEPCTAGEDWGTSKCSDYESVIPATELKIISDYLSRTDEMEFYNQSLSRFTAMTSDNVELDRRLSKFYLIQHEASQICVNQTNKRLAEVYLQLDPRVRQIYRDGGNRWLLIGENIHSIDPAWLCMQWYCHSVIENDKY